MLPGVGWTELLILCALAIIVVGPKDLPRLMRGIGFWVGKARAMAREFQSSFEELARESELDELRKETNRIQDAMRLPRLDSPVTPMTSAAASRFAQETNRKIIGGAPTAAEPASPAPPAAPAETMPPETGAVEARSAAP